MWHMSAGKLEKELEIGEDGWDLVVELTICCCK